MKRKIFVSAITAIALLTIAQPLQASLTFTPTELLNMTVADSNNADFIGANDGTMGTVAYADGAGPMTGVVGSTAFLGTMPNPGLGYVDYTVDAAGLARFNAALATEDAVSVIGWNDNDDIWGLGINAEDDQGNFYLVSVPVNGSVAGAPNRVLLTLAGLQGLTLTRIGVSIDYDPSNTGSDAFHASWQNVPEPGSLAIWGALCLVGVGARRRRRA